MAVDFERDTIQHVNCGSDASLDNIAAKSVAAWIYSESHSEQHIISKEDGWYFWLDADARLYFNLKFADATGKWKTTNVVLGIGNDIHVGATHSDRTSLAVNPLLYINGVSVAVTEIGVPAGAVYDDSGHILYLASYNGVIHCLDALLWDVRVAEAVWAADKFEALAAGYKGEIGDEVMWHDMCSAEGIARFPGEVLTAGTDYLIDRSGNGNHGDPINNPVGSGHGCGGCEVSNVRFFT